MKSRTFARLGMAVAMVAALGATACDDETPQQTPQQSIVMTPSSMALDVGQSGVVAVSVQGVTNAQISYASSNTSVATVSGSGSTATVTAVGQGSTTITATVAGTSLVAATQVTVSGTTPGLVSVSVSPASATIAPGGSQTLFANVSGTTNQAVTWSSQDNNVATVNSSGVVTGVNPGTAVIVATSQADANARGTATITVSASPVNVSIAPVNPSIVTGSSLQFSAVVTGSTNTAVTWESSNPAVASIGASTGLAQGLTAGSTIITARSAANPNAVASTTLTVTVPPSGNISIASVQGPAGSSNQNLFGTVNVTLNVDAPVGSNVQAVELILSCPATGDVVVARQNVSAGTSGQITFQVNTAEFDAATGAPKFRNENCEFKARLLGPNDDPIATASNIPVTLNNTSFLSSTITSAKQAIGPDGLQWNGGDVTVTVLPVIYAPNTSIARVSVTLNGVAVTNVSTRDGSNVPVSKTDETAADGFVFVFSAATAAASGGIGNIEDANVSVSANSVTAAGASGPTATLVTGYRLDNVEPATSATAFVADTAKQRQRRETNTAYWLNGPFAFSTFVGTIGTNNTSAIWDPAVDRVTVRVFVSDSTGLSSATRIPANATEVTTAEQLAESATSTKYAAWLIVTDALGNADTLRLQSWDAVGMTSLGNATFGVDKTAPTIQFAPGSAPADAKYKIGDALGSWIVEFQDVGPTPSGFATATPVNVTVTSHDTISTNNACLIGTVPSGTNRNPANCKPVNDDSNTPVQAFDTYQVYTAFVVDRALNKSNTVSRTALVDQTNVPTSSSPSFASSLDGGTTETFSFTLRDDLDLGTARVGIDYGAIADPEAQDVVIGNMSDAFGSYGFDVFTTNATLSQSFDFFIESIENTAAGAPTGVPTAASAANVHVTDIAGNQVTNVHTLGTAATAGATFTGSLETWLIISTDNRPSTIRAEVTVDDTQNNGANPFVRAELYYRSTTTAFYHRVAVNSNPLVADLPSNDMRYAYEFAESVLPNANSLDIMVLGVRANGTALATYQSNVKTN
ncbi:MAG TPA: Ig-like domain-containing protein [Longimicrobiales bacterium]|nr:Ig-like domain-containing protein [Longimicrobiales bacterium]